MSVQCLGKNVDASRCKRMISASVMYCPTHKDQKPDYDNCPCMNINGEMCEHPTKGLQFCQFHMDAVRCKNYDSETKCMNYIPKYGLCPSCLKNRPDPHVLLKESATRMRRDWVEKNGCVIQSRNSPKLLGEAKKIKINVPKDLVQKRYDPPESCTICLEEFQLNKKNTYKLLTCGHYFHTECIMDLIKMECPNCRAPIEERCLPRKVLNSIADKARIAEDERIQAEYEEDLILAHVDQLTNAILEEAGHDLSDLEARLLRAIATGIIHV